MAFKKFIQTVFDLETFGVDENAAIASIGIVDFVVGEKFEIRDQYYANINQSRNKELGRTFDPRTLEWWSQQPKEVQKQLTIDPRPLDDVMKEVCEFIQKDAKLWCQGTDFDVPILRSTLTQLGLEIPWKYSNLRDCRTLTEELGFSMRRFRDAKTHHNALGDVIAQAEVLNQVLFMIKQSETA